MKRYEFRLSIPSEQYLDYYRGAAKHVVARCPDGLTIQFPASLLTPFVTPEGIHGRFALDCDDVHRGARLSRLP